jgi:hypothetical protein
MCWVDVVELIIDIFKRSPRHASVNKLVIGFK